MKTNFLFKITLVAAALCLMPVTLAASAGPDRPSADTMQSSRGAFPAHASNLLKQVEMDALHVRDNADRLQARLHEGFWTDWQSYANLFETMRTRVNAMDNLLAQLRASQAEALPWQRQAIERIAPSVVNLSDTTEDAISTLNDNRDRIYFSNLGALADHLYNEAKVIQQEIGNFEKYADAHREAQQLRKELELRNIS